MPTGLRFSVALALTAALTTVPVIASVQPSIPLASEVRLRRQIYQGHGVTAFLLDIPPGEGSQMHRHDKDLLTVFVSGGRTTAVFEGQPPKSDTFAPGVVRYRRAGFAHSTRNDGATDFRAVLLEFDKPQGPSQAGGQGDIFCTTHFCVHEFTVAPGAALAGGGVAFFVPLNDTIVRTVFGRPHLYRSGSIWRGRYGWTNGGVTPATVIAIPLR